MSVSYPSSIPASALRRPLQRQAVPTRQSQTEQSGVPYPTPKQGKSGKSPWRKFLAKLFSPSRGKKVNKSRKESAPREAHSPQPKTLQRESEPSDLYSIPESAKKAQKSEPGDLYSIPELVNRAASRTNWRDAEIQELDQLLPDQILKDQFLKSPQKNKGLADPLRDDDPYQLLESEEHPDAVFFREIREKQRDASFLPKPAANSALSTWTVMQEMLPRHVDRPGKFWNPGKSKDSDIMANPDVLLREYTYDPLTQKTDLILESPPSSGNTSFRAAWKRMKNAEDDFLLPLDPEISPVLPLPR